MTKMQILEKINEVDDQLLRWYDKKPKIDPLKLKKAELERLLEAMSTIYELFTKCSDMKAEFHCGFEESGGHAYNCNDCPNKCDEWYQWDKEFKEKGE